MKVQTDAITSKEEAARTRPFDDLCAASSALGVDVSQRVERCSQLLASARAVDELGEETIGDVLALATKLAQASCKLVMPAAGDDLFSRWKFGISHSLGEKGIAAAQADAFVRAPNELETRRYFALLASGFSFRKSESFAKCVSRALDRALADEAFMAQIQGGHSVATTGLE